MPDLTPEIIADLIIPRDLDLSPDGTLVAYALVPNSKREEHPTAAIWIAATDASSPPRQFTAGSAHDRSPRWSPDGKTLYFMSSRTGVLNVWAIRFDGAAGHPVGAPFQVTAFDNPSLMMPADRDLALLQLSLAEHRLVLPLASVSGNIWLLENVDQ